MEERFSATLTMLEGYAFRVDYGPDDLPALTVDEAPPLGAGRGPNPARLLGTAIAHCLGASLLFCLRKARVEVRELRAEVQGTLVRNERGRLRIGDVRVTLHPGVAAEDLARIGRCGELFEDFCIVTESVRHGLPVEVSLEPVAPTPPMGAVAPS